jgi:hypothetical protein
LEEDMSNYEILELDIHEEGVRRAGEIVPQNLYITIRCTVEQTVAQLKELSSRLTYTEEQGGGLLGGGKKQVQKQVVKVLSHEAEWCHLKMPPDFAMWVLWTLLKEALADGWEPYGCARENHHLLRKQLE